MRLLKDLGMIRLSETAKRAERYGIYECPICKEETRARATDVKNGRIKRCRNCYFESKKKDTRRQDKKLYTTWLNMKARCYNKNKKQYKDYGGRGIVICDDWKNDFELFEKWCLYNGYKDDLQIDRIDNDKGYSPDNCRFVTRVVSTRNTRVKQSNNTTGYRGVVRDSRTEGKFIAQIGLQRDGKRYNKYIGKFDTAEEASIAYDAYIYLHNLDHTQNRKLERIKI